MNLTVNQICKAGSIKNIKGLNKRFLQEVKEKTKDRPEFMKWWDGKSHQTNKSNPEVEKKEK